jgi:hypothetical protein
MRLFKSPPSSIPERAGKGAMKTHHAIIALLIVFAQSASAQDHLIPDRGFFVRTDHYRLKVRDVLARAFEEDVTSKGIVLPSFEPEYAVGLRKTREGVEAFVLKASSSIWDVEFLKSIEEGRVSLMDENGKRIPPERLEQNDYYQELKKSTLSDHRKIKTDRKARPIPASLAAKIHGIWNEMLLAVKRPPKTSGVDLDGVTYCFSAAVPGKGQLNGMVWSPSSDSKTGHLVALTEALAEYASGKADLARLTEQVEKAARP